MGMIIFIIASGLTLVFGLMDVLNFGHGVFIALGAFVATTCWAAWATGRAAAGCGATWWRCFCRPCWWPWPWPGAVGLAFERVIVRPVYGLHLKQILITMGGMIVGEELIKVIWGPLQIRCRCPRRCAARCCWAMPRSRSTACWPWPSAWWCSGAGLDAERAPRSAC
jgi:branched-chain amino acid transport system permease protein